MKKILLFSFVAISTCAIAQKSSNKKVDTRFINVPNYDASSTDFSSLTPSFAVGNSIYGAKRLKDTKSTCVVKGGSLKDAKELTTYYYEHDVTRPASYLFLKDASGNTVYASQTSSELATKADYGKDKCEHWIKANMEKKYEADKASWEKSDHSAHVSNLKEQATTDLNQNGIITYNPIEIEVYSAKGKEFDYTEIEEAFELASSAYEDINKNGYSNDNMGQLEKAIAIWKKEIENVDLDDKEARINKKIAQGLYINLAYAHFMCFEMDDAAVYAQKADESFGSFTNNTRTAIQAFRMDVNRRKTSINKNAELIKDVSKMNELASQSSSSKFTLTDYSGTLEDAKSDYQNFSGAEMSNIAKASEDANLQGGGTSYDKYVVPNSVPKTLSILNLQETLTEFPIGITEIDKLASVSIPNNQIATIPAEIGNMESLKKLTLSKNKITELPDEIGNCSNLTNLNLSGNPIEKLPESLKNCTNLKSINLKNTKVSPEHSSEIQGWLPKCKIKI